MSSRKSSVRKRSAVSKRSSSHFTANKRMKDSDGRGYRGRDAEKQVLAKLEKRGWTCFHDFSRGHDILAIKGNRQVYIDVKEINEYVSAGSNKVERGRIQVDKREVKKWLEYPESYMIVKINRINKKEEWKGFKAKKVWELIKNRKSDPIKLSWSELESIGEWKKEPTIK